MSERRPSSDRDSLGAGPRRITPSTTLRVLIVEDEDRLRELMCDVLPGMGYETIAARTAEQARRLIADTPPDIAILDLNLPVMGGMDFLGWLRKDFADLPVIIMTGFGSLDDAKRAIHFDVVEFLTKPCHLGEIEAALGRAKRKLLDPTGRDRGGSDGDDAPMDLPPDTDAAASGEPLTLAERERRAILAALERNNGNRTAAAQELGISRRTLYNRLAEYEADGPLEDQ
ncbi:MAG: response regulator [Phycisphaera sp.]|nr:response regulator [Phycisphaera sp.]